jgi:ribosomal protein S18 acetylase RimI-like enzyme
MSTSTCQKGLSVRPATDLDEPFLFTLYASTRAAELAAWGWDDSLQEKFLELQFRAQQQHYGAYPSPVHWLIERQAPLGAANPDQQLVQPIGRLLLSFMPAEIRLVDIALLPDFRGQGIGAALVGWVQAQARAQQKAVRLHVAPASQARKLYERLGFNRREDLQTHWLMEWIAPELCPATSERNHVNHAG